jgi:hypothetical protein
MQQLSYTTLQNHVLTKKKIKEKSTAIDQKIMNNPIMISLQQPYPDYYGE